MTTAVFFHAHPDDESIATGGTMARMASEGHRVVLVTATAGELGQVPEGFLEPGEDLATRRVKELAASCAILGVARHECLGYGDSGMAGTPTNDRNGSFWSTDVETAAAALAAILRQEGADVLTIYDEKGVYGHPDHIQVHRVGNRAAEMAGVERVFMATMNSDYVKELMTRAAEFGIELPADEGPPDNLGVEASRINTAVDVSAFLDVKRRSMAAHASQIPENSFFLSVPPEVFALMWSTEWYVELGAPPPPPVATSLVDSPAP